ncbi:MAG: mandelate racemase/muconate lactonizing enzyme family protein [Rhodospirillales bacterium]|nr:mandelate racemase/muconate lactonizing enzyme family protein [Rhodospirillales bacterium]MDP6804187.1 mandelate racemase/muconate lactonizing enzyme family protein [Rhodospirillales bacterium]
MGRGLPIRRRLPSGLSSRREDGTLKGHGYAKTAIDIACWDLLGQSTRLPLCVLLGGRFGGAADAYHEVTLGTPREMATRITTYRAQGYRRFQLKVGGDADEDVARIRATSAKAGRGAVLIADANGGWRMQDAARVVRAVHALDVYIEQPCPTYDECLAIRRRTDRPFILDESIDSLAALLRAHRDGAMDAINIKLSKFGGLTRARQIRDLCVEFGIPVNIDETGGGDVTAAVLAHLAHSTPERNRLAVAWSFLQVRPRTASGAPRLKDGGISAPTGPDLGIRVREDVLGDPILDFA